MRDFLQGLVVGLLYAVVHSTILIKTGVAADMPWWGRATCYGLLIVFVAALLGLAVL